ncbi:hypothetical protein AVEN_178761-1 [Araneus ventricosus]|uniref:Gustatory receptor n=1 Tax=Araneus ventricosus TaxID=182803 RepID=A0A4Y2DEH7_ARAVE|nr:hypothetical protein AVEN_258549-1 [Araneus ventricosus]GBM15181.1 hypothetical protein AVEN_38869-1 [Araneus ventricosus]GBM15216.1 hypothetical protein AVEN_167984-1 [Araneus ventricosus]GBM15233.1 hypothetical protein AVEN_178761-1 [Araneus ventricosus]
MALLIVRILPVFLAAFQAYVSNEKESKFWSLGYKHEEQKYRMIVTFIGEYIHYNVFFEFLCITALSYCLLISQYVAYLSQFNARLRNMNFNVLTQKGFEVLSSYNSLEVNIHLLKQTLSTALFLILLSCSLNTYGALAFYLTQNITPFLIVEYAMDAFMGSVVIYSLIIYSSKIPEAIQQIKETAGFLIENYQLSILSRGKAAFFLDRLEKKNVIFLSAGGMVDLKKSLLLSIIGAFFSYGLLILNLGSN